MSKRKQESGVTATHPVTERYRVPLPILVPTNPKDDKKDFDGLANFDGKKPLQPVKVFGPEHVNRVRKSKGSAWRLFVAVTQLRDAHEKGDAYEIDAAFQKLFAARNLPAKPSESDRAWAAGISKFWSQPGWSKRTAPIFLPPAITQELELARLVLRWDNRHKQFMPAIYCENLTTAMFVDAALRNLRACPGCDEPFTPSREDQQYCSVQCGGRQRQRRLRERRSQARNKAH
jgi:hypothetical protein